MAPEVFKKFYALPGGDLASARPKADFYSLGVIFHEPLTGEHPWGQQNWDVRRANLDHLPTSPAALQPEITSALAEVCLWCLTVNPSRRCDSATALQEKLAPFRPFLLPTTEALR